MVKISTFGEVYGSLNGLLSLSFYFKNISQEDIKTFNT